MGQSFSVGFALSSGGRYVWRYINAGPPVPGMLGLSPSNGYEEKENGFFLYKISARFCSVSEEEEPCCTEEPLKRHRSGFCFG